MWELDSEFSLQGGDKIRCRKSHGSKNLCPYSSSFTPLHPYILLMPSSSRGFRRGSFRGRGKNSSSRGSGYRKIFHSTRVEDPAENALDGSLDLEDGQERSLKDSSESISSADEEENIHITNSYNVLLQSLNNQALKSKPTRKKQKISHEPSHALSEQAQDTVRDSRDEEAEDVDHVNEPEDGHVNSYQDDDQDEDEEREDRTYSICVIMNILTCSSWRPI